MKMKWLSNWVDGGRDVAERQLVRPLSLTFGLRLTFTQGLAQLLHALFERHAQYS